MIPQAVLPLLMNTLIASMFVAAFLTIACLNPSARRTVWMAVSYAFGVVEPITHLAVYLGADPRPMMILAPSSFLIGLALMSPALSIFFRKRPMTMACGAIILCGLPYYWFMGETPPGSLWHALAYQSFFAASMFLCAFTVHRDAPRSTMSRALGGVFVIAGAHFLLKPFVAGQFGTDTTNQDYASSLYAVFSQASGGVLLVAAGLLILIKVLQRVVRTNHGQARTDPLTGLPNRRALHEAFEALDGRARASTMSIAIIDLDHFKAINDQLGHDRGDDVLRLVADCLDKARPSTSTLARIGGEEFVVLLPDRDGELARLVCETLRLSISCLTIPGLSGVTASIGLAEVSKDEDLANALRRADRALYEAKHMGRDRCVVATTERAAPQRPRLSVVGTR